MDIISIFEALKKYGLLALVVVAVIGVLFVIVYLMYKKLLHRTKIFSKGQWIAVILLLGWFVG